MWPFWLPLPWLVSGIVVASGMAFPKSSPSTAVLKLKEYRPVLVLKCRLERSKLLRR